MTVTVLSVVSVLLTLVSCLQLGGVGVEPDAGGAGSGPGTLLSPEASAVRQVSLARRDRIVV
jgi:hypothetical protein